MRGTALHLNVILLVSLSRTPTHARARILFLAIPNYAARLVQRVDGCRYRWATRFCTHFCFSASVNSTVCFFKSSLFVFYGPQSVRFLPAFSFVFSWNRWCATNFLLRLPRSWTSSRVILTSCRSLSTSVN